MALKETKSPEPFIDQRPRSHPEWRKHYRRWQWLGDSLDGGEAYRTAIYGYDVRSQPIRNLIRHKHEYPSPREVNAYGPLGRPVGTDMAAQATDDDYEMRRARTPAPTLFPCCIHRHLSKIYSQTPKRAGNPDLLEWFDDVDGGGTTMAEYMRDTIAPLKYAYGQLDIICERPPAAEGQKDSIETRADLGDMGLDTVILSYILPENVRWWQLDARGRYKRVLIEEPDEDGTIQYRFWEPDKWTLYDAHAKVIDSEPHPYGRPPIKRSFDRRRIRCKNVGLPRAEAIAEIQREIYNRQSEMVLSDTTQVHPIMQGPEDFCQDGVSMPIGPDRLLPMKKTVTETGVSYDGFNVVEFPKSGAESLRQNIQDMKDDVDKHALLTKPAGGSGTTGQTVGQSGVSKRMDSEDGNTYLSEVAGMLETTEYDVAELFYLVKSNGKIDPADMDAVDICYPKDFDLFGPDELAGLITDWQTVLMTVGATPLIDAKQLKKLLRLILLGEPSENFVVYDAEIDAYVKAMAKQREQQAEMPQNSDPEKNAVAGENVPALTAGSDVSYSSALVDGGIPVMEPMQTTTP